MWAHEVRERLRVACGGFSPGTQIGVYLRTGEPGSEIVRLAREGHYDTIVLVRRSKLEPGRAQILQTVMRHSPCPFLMVGGSE
jgi:nucleotide-binding universal stress UspA family protein